MPATTFKFLCQVTEKHTLKPLCKDEEIEVEMYYDDDDTSNEAKYFAKGRIMTKIIKHGMTMLDGTWRTWDDETLNPWYIEAVEMERRETYPRPERY